MRNTVAFFLVLATGAVAGVATEQPQTPAQSPADRLEGAENVQDDAWKWCKPSVTCYNDSDCEGNDCGDWGYTCGTFWWPHSCWTYDIDAQF